MQLRLVVAGHPFQRTKLQMTPGIREACRRVLIFLQTFANVESPITLPF